MDKKQLYDAQGVPFWPEIDSSSSIPEGLVENVNKLMDKNFPKTLTVSAQIPAPASLYNVTGSTQASTPTANTTILGVTGDTRAIKVKYNAADGEGTLIPKTDMELTLKLGSDAVNTTSMVNNTFFDAGTIDPTNKSSVNFTAKIKNTTLSKNISVSITTVDVAYIGYHTDDSFYTKTDTQKLATINSAISSGTITKFIKSSTATETSKSMTFTHGYPIILIPTSWIQKKNITAVALDNTIFYSTTNSNIGTGAMTASSSNITIPFDEKNISYTWLCATEYNTVPAGGTYKFTFA